MEKKLIYLASPHSHTNSAIRTDRYCAARDCTEWLMQNGFMVFSPIVSSHHMTERLKWTDFSYWQEFDKLMISRCDELWVLIMPGTCDSKGVNAEINFARENGKRVMSIWKKHRSARLDPYKEGSFLNQGVTSPLEYVVEDFHVAHMGKSWVPGNMLGV